MIWRFFPAERDIQQSVNIYQCLGHQTCTAQCTRAEQKLLDLPTKNSSWRHLRHPATPISQSKKLARRGFVFKWIFTALHGWNADAV